MGRCSRSARLADEMGDGEFAEAFANGVSVSCATLTVARDSRQFAIERRAGDVDTVVGA